MEEMRYQLDLMNAMNQKLINNEKMMQMIIGTSNSAFLYCDFTADKFYTLGNWKQYFDFKVLSTKDLARIYDAVEEEYVKELREAFLTESLHEEQKIVCVRLKEKRMWINVEVTVVYDVMGDPTDKVIRFSDVTKFIAQNDELTFMAYYDTLTGLYNRNYFVQLLGGMINHAEKEDKSVAVMFVDIDDFRKINDSLGIIVGDVLVQTFGQFLSELSEQDIIVSHFNSDVYCIGIFDPSGRKDVRSIYNRIFDRTTKPFSVDGMDITIDVTVGVAEYPVAAGSALELISAAEIVMFKAKADGKNRLKYFDAPILQEFMTSVSIENKLKNAVSNREFMVYFQPQYHTIGKKLRGVEALLRWKDNEGNMISPGTFIPIAEKNGAIIPIGSFVIKESIRIFTDWRNRYDYPMVLSLNISAIQYKQPDFIDNLIGAVRTYHMKPEELELEITESILIDDYKLITEKLAVLRDYGMRISLDDFGTGYSSLSYLKGLPLDTLKIDKSFVDTVTSDENTQIIMESIMYMVKKLGLETIAEGVETEEQYHYLDNIECDNIQGFYLGRPMTAQDIENKILKLIV